MNKRLALLGLAIAPVAYLFGRSNTEAAPQKRSSASWVVPSGVEEINVKSYSPNGKLLMNRDISVEPGQVFHLRAK